MSDELVSPEALSKALSLKVYSADGQQVTFEEVIRSETPGQRVLAVFILCQDYVAQIARKIKPDALKAANARIVYIGCGAWQLIKPYSEALNNPYPMYSSSDASVYRALGMTYRNVSRDPRSTSVDTGSSPLKSLWTAITRLPSWGLHGSGDIKQNGGEFLFVDGKNEKLAHRMKATNDHLNVEELIKVLDLPSA